jgi:hypothetical protein
MVNMKGWQLLCEDGMYYLYYYCVHLKLSLVIYIQVC